MNPDTIWSASEALATGDPEATRENGYMIATMIELPAPLDYFLIHRIVLQNKRGNPELVVYTSINGKILRSVRKIQTEHSFQCSTLNKVRSWLIHFASHLFFTHTRQQHLGQDRAVRTDTTHEMRPIKPFPDDPESTWTILPLALRAFDVFPCPRCVSDVEAWVAMSFHSMSSWLSCKIFSTERYIQNRISWRMSTKKRLLDNLRILRIPRMEGTLDFLLLDFLR